MHPLPAGRHLEPGDHPGTIPRNLGRPTQERLARLCSGESDPDKCKALFVVSTAFDGRHTGFVIYPR